MKHSPLQLLRYVVPEVSCSANPTLDTEKPFVGGTENFDVEVAVKQLEASNELPGHSWSVEMTISQRVNEGQNFPYAFKVSLIGFFACNNGVPAEAAEERFVRINGSSVLYGAAREIVRSLTARGPWGEIVIPTLSFHEKETSPKEPNTPRPKAE